MLNLVALTISLTVFFCAFMIHSKRRITLLNKVLIGWPKSRLERHKEETSKVASFYVFLAGIFVLLIPIFILLFGITIGLLLFFMAWILLYAQFRRKLQTIGSHQM
ncbi:hypothetical protein DH09_13410 [Bacillaceae bacterium JMAK1]|nr:hypothetical protein DH09_13410 [Bacillaceae bacterium JMAK1]